MALDKIFRGCDRIFSSNEFLHFFGFFLLAVLFSVLVLRIKSRKTPFGKCLLVVLMGSVLAFGFAYFESMPGAGVFRSLMIGASAGFFMSAMAFETLVVVLARNLFRGVAMGVGDDLNTDIENMLPKN